MTAPWRPSIRIASQRLRTQEWRIGWQFCPGSPGFRLVLVTGRAARELRDLLRPSIRVEIWGSHGREQLQPNGSYKLFALDAVQQFTLQTVAREMDDLGFSGRLEVKPSSLAIHWRGLEPAVQEQIGASIQSVL